MTIKSIQYLRGIADTLFLQEKILPVTHAIIILFTTIFVIVFADALDVNKGFRLCFLTGVLIFKLIEQPLHENLSKRVCV